MFTMEQIYKKIVMNESSIIILFKHKFMTNSYMYLPMYIFMLCMSMH